VWADLPLFAGMSGGIRREAARQAREAVDLLAHHPSVLMWGVHNGAGTPRRRGADPERPGRLHRLADAITAQQLPSYGTTVVDRAVARAVRRSDRSRPVITHSGRVPSLPLLDGTDTQMGVGWYVGGLRSLEHWAAAVPRLVRFVSDFGAQALDEAAERSVARTWPSVDWADLARTHGIEAAQLADRVPPAGHDSPADWAAATRHYQASVLTHHVETLRRLKYHPTGGFCLTSFRSPPSGDPWAVTDHDGSPRPSHRAVASACAPVIVVADRLPAMTGTGHGLAVDVHVVNDGRDPVDEAVVTATIVTAEGTTRRRWSGGFEADAVTRVSTLQLVTPGAPGSIRLELVLAVGDSVLATNRYETAVVDRP
jgi:beta-mannosidase